MRQGHQNRRAADSRKLGDGRGSRPRDDEMALGHPLRQILEEGRHIGLDAGVLQCGLDPYHVLFTCLLDDLKPLPDLGRKRRQCRRYGVREIARALAAAEYEQPDRRPADQRRIGHGRSR